MSNTDGEDIQRIEGFNPGDKAYILTEEQYIKFEKQNDVIADLKFKLKNDAIFQEYSDLEKELASLREQLKLERKAGLEIAIKRLQIEIESWLIAFPRPVPGTTASFCIDTLNQAIRNIREIDMKSLPDGSLIEQLKQKEDESRELLDSISQLIYAMNTTGLPWNTDSTAEKAYANCRSLLKKHIG